ncbi:MAG: hypothetical protein MUF34_09680 [Polyangiaceae bacterium]|nr:hypothetical protein [Polyangiaceae bacterium]
MSRLPPALLVLTLGACSTPTAAPAGSRAQPSSPSPPSPPAPSTDASAAAAAPGPAAAEAAAGPAPEARDPDGNDDAAPTGEGAAPASGHFERVGRPPLGLRRICDLRPYGDALYAAHANQPLGTDGATITRYQPDDAKTPFRVMLDWNRPGEPTRGGGGGQGFLRVHAIAGRLFVPDADPPYGGFGLSEWGTEGFVFVSDAEGKFAPLRPGHRPPGVPDAEGRAGAALLPRAYHVIDVIRYRGKLYASTGSVPPGERAWRGPSPGALHEADASWARWTYRAGYPTPFRDGVWRLTFLVRFRDKLFAGIQDFDGREPFDFVVASPPPGAEGLGQGDLAPRRVTDHGGSLTLRWYVDRGELYWIAYERSGAVRLRATRDGETFREVALPAEAGRPTDVTRFRDALVVLTERGLYRIDGPGAPRALTTLPAKTTPFRFDDVFCGAPLAVFRNELYAGGQRDGSPYRFVPDEAAVAPAPP